MSETDGSVLVVYQGGTLAAVGGIVRLVAVQRVPDDDDRVAVHAERDGALDRSAGATVGLAGPEQVAGLGEGDLDGPAPRVPGDQRRGRGGQAGGDQREVVAAVGGLVAREDHADGAGMEGASPQAGELGQTHGLGALVAVDPEGCEGEGSGQFFAVPRRPPLSAGRPRLPVGGGARP